MGYNVLIADDMFLNRKLIKSVLEKNIEGVNFYDAVDGHEALKYIEDNDVDLIILDLIMPNKNGFDVLKQIKSKGEHKDIPVIVNSAVDEIDTIKKALELGANEYFTKPLTLEQLEIVLPIKVKNALKSYEQHKLLKQMNERLKEELRFANNLQHTLIVEHKELAGGSMVGKYISCSEIGGDFYDCNQTDERLWFIIADVSGHGVAAAMISSMIKVMFTNCVQSFRRPSEVLKCMNNMFYPMTSGKYHITAFVGMVCQDRLIYSNAGHPYPIVISSSNDNVSMLEKNGLILGVFEDTTYSDDEISVEKGDMIFCYTDGLLEPQLMSNGRKCFTCDDIYSFISLHRDEAMADIESFIEFTIEHFVKVDSRLLKDDVAIMSIVIK
ncbi:MAG TPA: fused response regulator/phosphatase [Clostridiales bacterium]|nr:fused response regulator/phosphatase [Clostridiales bacterium]